MQGTDDVFVPYGGDTDYFPPSVETPLYWANNNGCNLSPDSTNLENIDTTDNSTVTLFEYDNCSEGNEVLFYRVNDGGHNWPGGWVGPNFPWLLPINKDIHASVEIWNFFKQHKHPDIVNTMESDIAEERLSIFPNPATDQITIQFSNNIHLQKNATLTLSDLTGRSCLRMPVKNTSETFAVSHLSPGMYFVTVQNGEEITTQKIVVQ